MNKPFLISKTVADITRGPLPGSRKVFVDGVPFREVALNGGEAPLRLYDTSGPYTDESARIEIEQGLALRRRDWIVARGDVEDYEGRERRPEDDGLKRGELLSVPQFNRAGRKPLDVLIWTSGEFGFALVADDSAALSTVRPRAP